MGAETLRLEYTCATGYSIPLFFFSFKKKKCYELSFNINNDNTIENAIITSIS